MQQYTVTGMSCAACSARVEKAVSAVDGVQSCAVNLLTNSMSVEGTADEDAIISAVKKAGYGAYKKDGKEKVKKTEDIPDDETKKLKKRLWWSVGFLLVLMYMSMGHMMWGWPLPKFFNGNHLAMGLAQLLLTTVIMVINQKFFTSGFRGLLNGSPNMDTLVSLGSAAAYVYSVYELFKLTAVGNSSGMPDFYFESAAMILTLITVGKMLESYSKGKTTNAIKGLMELSPKTATVIRNGEELSVPVEEVAVGDIFIVRSGEIIPVDGAVIKGNCSVDESALTGESIPVEKNENSKVSAATLNTGGYIECRATEVGDDTALSKIIKMIEDVSATKAPIAKIADKVSGVFVPVVIGVALITAAVWLIMGQTVGFALSRAISVLVISCPCSLGLATPVAIMVSSGVGAKHGVLFKTAVSLEQAGKIKAIALDKTGTVTSGNPSVTDVIPFGKTDDGTLVKLAFSIEQKSEHPLSNAIVNYAKEKNISATEAEDFKVFAGNGISGKINGKTVSAGNYNFVGRNALIDENTKQTAEKLSNEGKTPLYFAESGELIGIIAVADAVKPDSAEAVAEFKKMGIKTVMLTGDNKRTAEAVARTAGIDEVISDVLPDGKATEIESLKKYGRVAMVGDGINDAPALTAADIGFAIGNGTDIAADSADVVLMSSSLCDVPLAISLSRKTVKNIKENLFWAFIYNVIGIPIAAGVFINLFGWQLNPMFAAAAMSLSSVCVVTNALRLNLFKYNKKKEVNTMKKTIKIEGMMCGHCSARVKTALEKLPEVENAVVDHKKGTAEITLCGEVSDEVIKNAVEAEGYKVL